MAFRNSLLLIAIFLVATTSVANCQLPDVPGVSNLPSAQIVAVSELINITDRIGVRAHLVVANLTLICKGVQIVPATVVTSNGTAVLTVPYPNATLINSSCILSAHVSIGGVTKTITSTLSSVLVLLSSVLNLFFAVLDAVLVNGTLIPVTA